jgi:hypothetical protein
MNEGGDLTEEDLEKWETIWAYFNKQWMGVNMIGVRNMHDKD